MNDKRDVSFEEDLARLVGDDLRIPQRAVINQMRIMANWRIPEVLSHGFRTAKQALLLARFMGWSEADCESVYYAGTVHDLGKLVVGKDILMKTSLLEDQEVEIVRKHTQAGYGIFFPLEGDLYQACALVALNHHERWDGKGYPNGIKGENIPALARLISVVDVYDCICYDRPYRTGMTEEYALEELQNCQGTQFDPLFVEKFCQMRNQ